MLTKQMIAAYEMFVPIHADYIDVQKTFWNFCRGAARCAPTKHYLKVYSNKTIEEVQKEITPEQFEARIHDLHQRYIAGEFSIGRFTELIGVPHWELWEILVALGLPVHN